MTQGHPPAVPHPARLLVLDLDGTLVDTAGDLTACANRLLARRSLKRIAVAELRPMIGDGVRALVERVLLSRGARPDARAVSAFEADYAINAAIGSRLFPGVQHMLRQAVDTGWRLAVCTNKPLTAARSLLETLGIGGIFAAVGAGDSFASRKPDPAHLLGTIAMARTTRECSVMVGDHRNDVAAARGAGIPCIFAGWGYGGPEMQQGAAFVAAAPQAVPAAAAALLDAGGHG